MLVQNKLSSDFGTTPTTSTVFSIGTGSTTGHAGEHICFMLGIRVDGFSKFGSTLETEMQMVRLFTQDLNQLFL